MKVLPTAKYQVTTYNKSVLRMKVKNPLDVNVPNVVGMTLSLATTTLSALNLGINIHGVGATITSQSPISGATVKSFSVINCSV